MSQSPKSSEGTLRANSLLIDVLRAYPISLESRSIKPHSIRFSVSQRSRGIRLFFSFLYSATNFLWSVWTGICMTLLWIVYLSLPRHNLCLQWIFERSAFENDMIILDFDSLVNLTRTIHSKSVDVPYLLWCVFFSPLFMIFFLWFPFAQLLYFFLSLPSNYNKRYDQLA